MSTWAVVYLLGALTVGILLWFSESRKRERHSIGREKVRQIIQNIERLGFSSAHADFLEKEELSDFSFELDLQNGLRSVVYFQQHGEKVACWVKLFGPRGKIAEQRVSGLVSREIEDLLQTHSAVHRNQTHSACERAPNPVSPAKGA